MKPYGPSSKPYRPSSTDAPFTGSTSSPFPKTTLLSIVPVIVTANGQRISTHAFLDSGSEQTLIREDFARKLNLRGPSITTTITTVNGPAAPTIHRRVRFRVNSVNKLASFDMEEVITIKSLNLPKRHIDWNSLCKSWPHLNDVHLKSSGTEDVTILIGLDHPAIHEVLEYRSDPTNHRAPERILPSLVGV